MQKDLVSVIIPTYKRPERLAQAIDSVLAQEYRPVEVIIVDDNDPNTEYRHETEKVMIQYQNHANVKYIQHSHNKNGSAARNTGFRNSEGEYIMFLDDDDEFLPGKIEAQKKCLDDHDDTWGACYTTYVVKNPNGKIAVHSSETREGNLLLEELKRNLYIGAGSNLMIRRTVIEDIGGFDESFKRNQDQEFLTRILLKYKLAYAPVKGILINAHPRVEGAVVDFEVLTQQYLQTFDHVIKALSQKEQREIVMVLNLQRIRVMAMNKRDFRTAFSIARENGIGMKLILKYSLHLLKRKITKKNYGFQYSEK